jgi:hypothetical protein
LTPEQDDDVLIKTAPHRLHNYIVVSLVLSVYYSNTFRTVRRLANPLVAVAEVDLTLPYQSIPACRGSASANPNRPY